MKRTKPEKNRESVYTFRLFVAGNEPNSCLARKNLKAFCDACLPGRTRIDIVDVFEDFKSALDENVVITPALQILGAETKITIYGNLGATEKIKNALLMNGVALSPGACDF